MAITRDSIDAGLFDNGGTLTVFTVPHTCTGTNLLLAVALYYDNASAATITSVTYNGVAMSLGKFQASVNIFNEAIYYLIAPTTGLNNIVVTTSVPISLNSKQIGIRGVSYTGVSQSSQPDSSGSIALSPPQASFTVSTTVVAANCWLVSGGNNDQFEITGVTAGGMSLGQNVNGWLADSNGVVPTGLQSITYGTPGGATGYDTGVIMSISPAGIPGGNGAFLLKMIGN